MVLWCCVACYGGEGEGGRKGGKGGGRVKGEGGREGRRKEGEMKGGSVPVNWGSPFSRECVFYVSYSPSMCLQIVLMDSQNRSLSGAGLFCPASLTFTKLISTMASDTAVFTPWLKHFTKFHSTEHQTLRVVVDT